MKTWHWLWLGVLILPVAIIGCGSKAVIKEYDVHGTVTQVDADKKTVRINHEDIPGYMGAMEMPFEVADPALLHGLQPSDRVEARLQVKPGQSGILTQLRKVSSGAADPAQAATPGLTGPEGRVQANRATLAAADQELVKAQDFCPIETENRLGSMGKPFKILIKGQPVFLCCDGCVRDALAEPDKTLAKVEELKRKAQTVAPKLTAKQARVQANRGTLPPADQELVKAQDFCPIETENRLGSMGKPCKVMIKGQPVFLCCPACKEDALANPDQTLAKVEELKRKAKAAEAPR